MACGDDLPPVRHQTVAVAAPTGRRQLACGYRHNYNFITTGEGYSTFSYLSQYSLLKQPAPVKFSALAKHPSSQYFPCQSLELPMTRASTIVVIVDGPDFYCGALFGFEPKICFSAAPKLENLFLGRGLEKCRAIAASQGWGFRVHPVDPVRRNRPPLSGPKVVSIAEARQTLPAEQ